MRNLLPVLLLPLVSQAFAPPKRHSFSSRSQLEAKKKSFAPDYFDVYDDENGLHIPNRLAFTTAKWQDMDAAQEAFNMLVEAGISFVSCTPGKEKMLGRSIREQDLAVTVAASYNARFKFGGESSVVSAMESIIDAMDVNQVDILQVRPSKLSTVGLGALAEGIRSSVDEGYCSSGGAIDITNKGALKSLCRKLEQRDEALLTNQFEFSLVNRKHERMIDSCKELGVIPLIRHPLGRDLLASGKWTSEEPNGTDNAGPRFSYKILEKWEPLHSMMYRIMDKAQSRAGKQSRELKDYRARRFDDKKKAPSVTPAQIAIHYVIAKGGVPLVDVYNEETAEELMGCLGWRLTDEEVRMLDQAAELSSM